MALGRWLRGVEPDKTCHFYKNICIITFSVTKFLTLLLINYFRKSCETYLCLREMNTSKIQGHKIAQRMHCNYNTGKTPTLETSDVVVPVSIFSNGVNTGVLISP